MKILGKEGRITKDPISLLSDGGRTQLVDTSHMYARVRGFYAYNDVGGPKDALQDC